MCLWWQKKTAVERGDRYLSRGKPEKALRAYRKALKKNPNDPSIYSKLIAAKDQIKKDWTEADFVESLGWVMKQQEQQNPELRDLHAKLSGQEGVPIKIVGLTGGLASGKSTVGQILEELGFPRSDADVVSHQLLTPNTPAWQEIVNQFGKTILNPDRTMDRKKLADVVFRHPAQRKILEAILHPKIRSVMDAWIKTQAQAGQKVAVLEIPLLFESGWNKEHKWDAIIVATCSEKTQLERAEQERGLPLEEANLRIQAQLPLAEKTKQATYVVNTEGTLEATRAQVEAIALKLLT